MTEEPELKGKCDPDDILCEMELLIKMRNLRSAFGDESFRKEFPSLVELSGRLDESIREKDADVRAKLEACNLPVSEITEVSLETEEEAEE